MASWSQRLQLEISDSYALGSFDRVPRLKKTIPQVVAGSIRESYFVPRRVLAAEPFNFCAGGTGKNVDFLEREKRFQFQQIRLRQSVRMHDAIGEVAVVRQEDEARGMVFKATHRKHALRHAVQQIAQRTAAFRVAHCGDDFWRLVEQQIYALTFGTKKLS
jgi:hypothetical protein